MDIVKLFIFLNNCFEVTHECFPAAITPSGTPMIGQSFSLLCTVTETDSLQLTISYYWFRGQLPLTTNSGLLTFDELFLSDAGLYRCEVTVSSDGHQITVNSSYDIDFKSKQLIPFDHLMPCKITVNSDSDN